MATGLTENNHETEASATENEKKTPEDSKEEKEGPEVAVPPPVTSSSNSDEKEVAKTENVWFDVAIVKSTSFTVNHYTEKIELSLKDDVTDAMDTADQVSTSKHRIRF